MNIDAIQDEVEAANRRGGPRLHVPLEGRARRLVGVSRVPFAVGISDISRTGMRLECLPDAVESVEPGDRLHVVIPGEGDAEPVAVTGTVVWDRFVRGKNPWVVDATGTDDARWRFGLQFDEDVADLVHRLPRPAAG